MVDVSVVVSTFNSKGYVAGLFDSLDRQSLAVTAFEVLVVDRGSTDGTGTLLAKLAANRPNVRLLASAGDDDGVWLPDCTGEFVLQMGPEARLFPEALQRVTHFARERGLDVVLARVAQSKTAVPEPFLSDADEVSGTPPELLAGAASLVRRDVLAAGPAVLGGRIPESTGIFGSYPVFWRPGGAGADEAAGCVLAQDEGSAAWHADRLHVEASGTCSSADEAALGGATVTALLRATATGLSIPIPSAGQLVAPTDGGTTPLRWALTADVDVASAYSGAALPHGTWELDVQVTGPGVPRHRPLAVGAADCPAALLPGSPVVVGSQDGRLQIDVGPTRHPLISNAEPSWATVRESAAGSLLTLQLPLYVVPGVPELEGEVALDNFRLRAWVRNDGSQAWLASYLSGLAGTAVLNAKFGDGAAKPTGLQLSISGVGEMTVAKVEPPPRPAAGPTSVEDLERSAKAAGGKGKAAGPAKTPGAAPKRQARGPVARLRRAAPQSLEPVIRRIAGSPVARDLYRRVTGL